MDVSQNDGMFLSSLIKYIFRVPAGLLILLLTTTSSLV